MDKKKEIKYDVFGANWWYFVDRVVYDWWYSNEAGEEFKEYEVGFQNVRLIGFHGACKNENYQYCDVVFEDGSVDRIYNIHSMQFKANI